jgi:diaminopimelate epimerase
MRIPFAKYQAAGNDFIVVRAEDVAPGSRIGPAQSRRLAALAMEILARRTGIGADGLFVVSGPADAYHALAVRIFNSDGSEAEMSGNGIRCAAAWLLDNDEPHAIRPHGRGRIKRFPSLAIETQAGIRKVECKAGRRGNWVFRVNMGRPILDPAAVPFAGEGARTPVTGYLLPLSNGTEKVTVTSMGNPHCSVFVRDFDLDWRSLGSEIERHPLFPNRTNVEFVRIGSRRRIEVRFWERGVGETASSGTGSSAAAVAAALNGFTERRVRVITSGGELEVDWTRPGQLYLTGPVRLVGSGHYEWSRERASE